ncbi:MAG: hypothetical protein U9N61_04945 [Euryarchaeota archaeon]|nr:hypothetical protein [Euryarchaeota archaeon]
MIHKKIFYGVLAVCALSALIVGCGYIGFGYLGYMELRQESGVDISYDVVCTQGAAENLTGMERVKVHGTVRNTGNEELKNITVTVIFTDTAHDRVVRKTVVEGVDLLPECAVSVEFDAGHLREMTIPKTSVDKTIQVNWIEDGQLKNFTTRLDAGMNKAKL